MEPITRKETFLAKAGGQSVNTPKPITREEMFLQKIAENGGSGGGVPSWNDMPDKPFGETTVMGDTLTWDGNTEGLVSVDTGDLKLYLYLVADNVITADDLKGGLTAVDSYGNSYTAEYSEVEEAMALFGGALPLAEGYGYIIPTDNFVFMESITFPNAGIYFSSDEYASLVSLTIPGYNGFETTTVKTIDPKYLPEALRFGEDENAVLLPPTQFVYDDSYEVFAIEGYIDFVIGKTYKVAWNGVEYTTEGVAGQYNGENLVMIGNPVALGGTNNDLPFAIACLMGAIAAIPLDGSTSVNVGIRGYLLTKIPLKYTQRMVVDVYCDDVPSDVALEEKTATIKTSGVTAKTIVDAVTTGGDVVVWLHFKTALGDYGEPCMYYPMRFFDSGVWFSGLDFQFTVFVSQYSVTFWRNSSN